MDKKPTAGIILAAGSSSRLGRPKQLVKIGGDFLLARIIDVALASRLTELVLVLGHQFEKITAALGSRLRDPRLHTVINEHYQQGMSTSLQQGLLHVTDAFPSIMVLLADYPLLDTNTIDLLLTRFWDSDQDICVPCFKGQRGVPVVFSRRFYGDIMAIRGDVGARSIIRQNPRRVLTVELRDNRCLLDIDEEKDINYVEFSKQREGFSF